LNSNSATFFHVTQFFNIFIINSPKQTPNMQRRNFLQSLASVPLVTSASIAKTNPIIKPARLKVGDTIGLVCPAGAAFSKEEVKITDESLRALGFKIKYGKRMWERYGYLAGKDADRAADINEMFADSSVQGIVCLHGGWGCARILPLLDYETIRKNPKVIVGYSDITALLLGIHAQTGLVTMHGPVGSATWNEFTVKHFRSVLMNGEATLFENPKIVGDNLVLVNDRVLSINSGKTKGKLLGGNLTVLCHLLGSKYVPDWKNSLLFCEDIQEAPYRIDRMITHLKLTGVLDEMNGFIFGKCTKCDVGNGGYGSLTIEDLFEDHIHPLNKPAFAGAMIGHITHKFTIPLGIEAEMDADKGTIQLLESAVL
jgi:muramoyltetrapeptide carboxypeptidase